METQWKKAVHWTARSDIGLRRANNQDSHAVKVAVDARHWLERGHLFIVADGMGAHAAGEVASRLAVDTVMQSYTKRRNESAPRALANAVHDAHRLIREKSHREDAYRDMGTTCDAMVMLPYGLVIAHVGDSRVYRLRGEVIEQLTFDHSLVWDVCQMMNLPFDQAPSHIPKNQITRSLGPTEKMQVDVEGPFPIMVGDIYLACSDGLSGQVNDKEIGEILRVLPLDSAVETLVNLANLRGGPDNITVVVAQALQAQKTTEEVDRELEIPISSWGLLAGTIGSGIATGAGFVLGHLILGSVLAFLTVVVGFFFFRFAAKSIFSVSPFEVSKQCRVKEPYMRAHCPPSQEFAERLAKMFHELRQATQGQLTVHSPDADACEKNAKKALRTQDFSAAIREFALAINHMMRELKKRGAKKK